MDEYDAIVIGGGLNGLTAASYLATAGLKVMIVERRWETGGAATTEEQSGVRFNTHALYMMMVESMPAFQDLNLGAMGCAYVKPEKQLAFLSKNKKDVVLYNDIEKSVKSIERLSKKDAQTYRKMMADFELWVNELLIPQTYRPPIPAAELVVKLVETEAGSQLSALADSTSKEIVESYGFETDELKAALLYLVTMWGINPNESGVPATLAPLYINRMLNASIIRGGTHRLSSSIFKVLIANKGVVEETAEVDKILLEDGKAVGVKTLDGREFRSKIVVSSVDPVQTFSRFIGEEKLENMGQPGLARLGKEWQWESTSLYLCHLAANQIPDFSLSGHSKEVNDALIQIIGVESFDGLLSEVSSVRDGELAKSFHVTTPTQFDSSQTFSFIYRHAPNEVPGGRLEAVRLETIAPFEPKRGSWDELMKEYAEQLIGVLKEYAPNMRDAKIVRKYPYPPTYIEQKMMCMKRGSIKHGDYTTVQMGYLRPSDECSQYATPISSLYLCGASTHPGGMVVLGSGYNAANRIVEDLGIKPPWPLSSVRYADAIKKGYAL